VEKMMELRKDETGHANKAYIYFCSKFLKYIVGFHKLHLAKHGSTILSLATPSDEAFGLLLLENNEALWCAEFLRKSGVDDATTTPLPATKYTSKEAISSTKTPSKAWSTKKNQGWSFEAIQRFNYLCRLIKQDRKKHGDWFVSEFLASGGGMVRKSAQVTEVAQIVRADNDLISDDEDDGNNDNHDDENHEAAPLVQEGHGHSYDDGHINQFATV
jgi:hypothetical protein